MTLNTILACAGIVCGALSYVWHPLLGVGVIFIGIAIVIPPTPRR